jgi:glutathione S-transferase
MFHFTAIVTCLAIAFYFFTTIQVSKARTASGIKAPAISGNPIAAVLGLVWIAGRVLYMTGYSEAANKRGTGFGIQGIAAGLLWVGALGAIIWRLIHA